MAKPTPTPVIQTVQHLQIILLLTELETELDTLALDGWAVVSCFPLHANVLELGKNARTFCLLKRTVLT